MGAIVVTPNVTYKTGLQLDVYRPGTLTNRPAIVYVHGGGWAYGTRDGSVQVTQCTGFAKRGFVVFSVSYTLCPPGNRTPNYRQPPIDDVADAVAWVRTNGATYGADGTKVAMLGQSAGGQLALMAAFTKTGSSRPDAVLGWSAPTRFEDFDFVPPEDSRVELAWDYIGVADLDDPAMDTFSPYYNVGSGDPPIRLVNSQDEGNNAFGIPVSNANDMHTAAQAAGVDSTKVIFAGSVHADFQDVDTDDATDWLREKLEFSGERVIVVPIAASGDDGERYHGDSPAVWPPVTPDGNTNNANLILGRKVWHGTFNFSQIIVSLLRFDTSVLPDDVMVTAATLWMGVISFADANDRALLGEWYDPSNWPIDDADWANPVGTNAFNTDITTLGLVAATYKGLDLLNPGSINKQGYTALRFGISGDSPPQSGVQDNIIVVGSFDHTTIDEPQLLITFTPLKQSFYATRRRAWR